jgi:hypothetical protein
VARLTAGQFFGDVHTAAPEEKQEREARAQKDRVNRIRQFFAL